MRTRFVGNEPSPGSRATSEQSTQRRKPTVSQTGGGAAPPRYSEQQLLLEIPLYCGAQTPFDADCKMACVFGPDGQAEYFSKSWLAFRGSSAKQERGAGWWKGLHPEDLDRCMDSFQRAFENRETFHFECRVRRADGSAARVLFFGTPRYLPKEHFRGYFGCFTEIDNQDSGSAHQNPQRFETLQKSQQAIREIIKSLEQSSLFSVGKRRKGRRSISEKVLSECLDISVTPMVVVDQNGCAIYCNNAFRKFAEKRLLSGGTKVEGEAVRRSEDADRKSSARDNQVESRDLAASLKMANFDLRVAAQRLAIGGNKLTAFSIVDVSHEQRTTLLESAFLHDLVNTAGGIQILLDLLAAGSTQQDHDEYLKLLQVSIQRLVSEIAHEKMLVEASGPAASVFNVRGVLEALAEYYCSYASARNCRLEIAKGGDESIQLLSDQTPLIRVLDRILRNVIEASSPGSVVRLGCRRIGGNIELWISDPSSLSKDSRMKIFSEAFSKNARVEDKTVHDARSLFELCGGTVVVSPHEESGTTFSVRYPATSETISSQKRYRTKTAS